MDRGWIKICRKLSDNWIWHKLPFSYGQAWIDLIMIANHKPGFLHVRGLQIPILRGQVGYSVVSLGTRWGWSRSAVNTFLNRLETGQQIEQQKNNASTLITILNYETYQATEQQNLPQKSSKRAAAEQQQSTNKNEKNEKNDKKEDIEGEPKRFTPPTLDEVLAYCKERGRGVDPYRWMNHYQSNGWMVGKNKMKDWKAAVRTWEEAKPAARVPKLVM